MPPMSSKVAQTYRSSLADLEDALGRPLDFSVEDSRVVIIDRGAMNGCSHPVAIS